MNVKIPFKINWTGISDSIMIGIVAFGISALTKQMNGTQIIIPIDDPTKTEPLIEGDQTFYANNEPIKKED